MVVNAAGLCIIGIGFGAGPDKVAGFLNSVTGQNLTADDVAKLGDRIGIMRHAFNLREGINELTWKPHPRIIGDPPQKEGPLAGVTENQLGQIYYGLGALDWDPITTKPSKKKLLSLGMNDLAEALWPPQKGGPFGPPPK